MKTNISGLMNMINDQEEKINNLSESLLNHSTNISIQELNGKENIIENYKEEFNEEFLEYKKGIEKLTKLKSILYKKNNLFKLDDGRSIQDALTENINLRKLKNTYELLLTKTNSKSRVTEVNNSYFESRTINFDNKKLKKELEKIQEKIQETDFNISKLNSIEFDI